MGKFKIKHGMRHVPEYRIWKHIRERCNNPKSQDYPDYGGRGITVCEPWQDFEAFFADMGERPSSQHSIDRRDNDAGYSPLNCRWATLSEQANNKRNNIHVEFDGEQLSLAEACRRAGKADRYITIYQRLRTGQDFNAALESLAPRQIRRPRSTFNSVE